MPISFPFQKDESILFGIAHRPIAKVYFRHRKENIWRLVTMIVDTGADYTLLPKFLADFLGVSLSKDCRVIRTQGVGGESKVFLLKNKMKAKIGDYERTIPLGFLDNDYIPPLLGRQEFFETFRVVFEKFRITFQGH